MGEKSRKRAPDGGVAGLLSCWVAELLGCWVAGLGCWAGLLGVNPATAEHLATQQLSNSATQQLSNPATHDDPQRPRPGPDRRRLHRGRGCQELDRSCAICGRARI